MRRTFFCQTIAFLFGLAANASAMAGHVRPIPPLSAIGKQILASQPGKKDVNPCPDGKTVALPVYPDSYCISYMTSTENGDSVFPALILVSKAPVATVRNWYSNHLDGWKYNAELQQFARPDWTLDHMTTEPAVQVQKATDQNLALYRMSYDLSGMKTLINLIYKPHGGKS